MGGASEDLPSIFSKRVLVMGCGNILFGDDGFGPAVAQYLQEKMDVPEDVCVEDVGTAAAKLLFTLSHSESVPEKVVIIDAVELKDRKPGEVFEIELDALPESKMGAYAIHQFPDTNLLKVLRDERRVDIRIIACQAGRIPKEVEMGLSVKVLEAVPQAAVVVMGVVC